MVFGGKPGSAVTSTLIPAVIAASRMVSVKKYPPWEERRTGQRLDLRRQRVDNPKPLGDMVAWQVVEQLADSSVHVGVRVFGPKSKCEIRRGKFVGSPLRQVPEPLRARPDLPWIEWFVSRTLTSHQASVHPPQDRPGITRRKGYHQ